MARSLLTPVFLILGFSVIAWVAFADGNPADLRASWLAAQFYAAGQFDQIYPADSTVFLMRPPESWGPAALAMGYDEELFPYIYPPLWAALLAPLTRITDFAAFDAFVGLVNPALFAGTLLLARRAAGSAMSPLRWMAVAMLVLLPTTIGAHALLQKQPQVLVAFLTVLAIERDRSGAQRAAGIALAFAAALKLYPAFYALFWLAQGRNRAAASFALAGGALGLASVALAGWPLHAAFLAEFRVISGTGLVNGMAYNLDATLAHVIWREALQPVVSLFAGPVPEGAGGVFVVAKTPVWSAVMKLALLAVLGAAALAFRRARGNAAMTSALWPAAMAAIAFVSPMAFAYHYLAPAAFAPMLLDRLGPRGGLAALALAFVPTVMVLPLPLPPPPGALILYQSIGTAGMALLVLGYCRAAWRGAPAGTQ